MPVTLNQQLVFGLLALQNGLIDQAQLVAAFQAWTRDKTRTLSEHLLTPGAIDQDDHRLIEALVVRHLQKHDDDSEKSLASLAVGHSTREALAAFDDPQIEATLDHVGSGSHEDADPTLTFSVGTSTTEDQRFRVLRPHARGGLGAVFVALDEELNREVALKQILDSHADNAISRQRFLLEAEITGGLEHPGIVPVYGLGSYDDGRPFYAMRFIRGDSLKDAVACFHSDETLRKDLGRRSLEFRKLLNRFTDVCNAIDYAHSRGVLHRDIKPGNVIIGKHGETLVVDWGLAKSVDRAEPASDTGERILNPSSASGSAETLQGSALGTPAYMSPEQALGDLDALGPRSDVYSLGATLYCLLTGKAPFEGRDLAAVLGRVKTGDFPKPRTIDPTIDSALEAVCLKAMAMKPENRYSSCQALADDVERWAADEPVTAWQEPLTLRARRWARRNRTAVISLAASVLVALVGTAAVLAVQTQANGRLKQANIDLENANDRVTKSNAELSAANEQVKERFELAAQAIKLFHGQVGDDLVLKADQFKPLRNKLLEDAADFYGKLESLLQNQPDQASRAAMGNAYFELGELMAKIGDRSAALAAHHKGLEVRQELDSGSNTSVESSADVAKSLFAVGVLLFSTGKPAESLAHFEATSQVLERLPGSGVGSAERRALLGKNYGRIAYVFAGTGKTPEATSAYRKSIEVLTRLVEENSASPEARNNLAVVYNFLGILQSQSGLADEAMESYQTALAIQQQLVEEHPAVTDFQYRLAGIHNSVGILQMETGKRDEAVGSYERALAIQQKLADDNPAVTDFRGRVADGYHNIGLLQSQTGKRDAALESYRRGLAINQQLADDHPVLVDYQLRVASSHNSIGILEMETGKWDEAAASYRQALTIFQNLVDDNSEVTDFKSRLADAHANLGRLQSSMGKPIEALQSQRQALAIRQKLVDDEPAVTFFRARLASSHNSIGNLLSKANQRDKALESYRTALPMYQELSDDGVAVNEYQDGLADTHQNIGNQLSAAGQTAEALVEFELAREIYQELATANPATPDYPSQIAGCLTDTGDAFAELTRSNEARESYEQAIAILETLVDDNPFVFTYAGALAHAQYRLALLRLTTGDNAQAVTTARKAIALYEGLRSRGGSELFGLACCHAALSILAGRDGSGISSGNAEAEADQAISLLRQAIETGFTDTQAFANEPVLAPLRNRSDFKALHEELTLRANPVTY